MAKENKWHFSYKKPHSGVDQRPSLDRDPKPFIMERNTHRERLRNGMGEDLSIPGKADGTREKVGLEDQDKAGNALELLTITIAP